MAAVVAAAQQQAAVTEWIHGCLSLFLPSPLETCLAITTSTTHTHLPLTFLSPLNDLDPDTSTPTVCNCSTYAGRCLHTHRTFSTPTLSFFLSLDLHLRSFNWGKLSCPFLGSRFPCAAAWRMEASARFLFITKHSRNISRGSRSISQRVAIARIGIGARALT